MEKLIEKTEFEILGYKLRSANKLTEGVDPAKVVLNVKSKIEELRKLFPQHNNEHLLVLTALSLAEEKLMVENQFKLNIDDLKAKTVKAMKIVDELSGDQSIQ